MYRSAGPKQDHFDPRYEEVQKPWEGHTTWVAKESAHKLLSTEQSSDAAYGLQMLDFKPLESGLRRCVWPTLWL